MTSVLDHIERLREKPHHVRKQIAIASAFGISAFIAFVWLAVSLSTGAFKVEGSSFADLGKSPTVVIGGESSVGSSVAGAAAAFPSFSNNSAVIQVVDAPISKAAAPEATVIPF